MNDLNLNPRAEIGGNAPPSALELLREDLDAKCASLIKDRDFWLARAGAEPEEITTPAEASSAAQLAKDVRTALKDIEAAHKLAKAPYLDGGRLVDAHFKAIGEPLTTLGNILGRRMTLYQRKVENEERMRREAVAAKAREEALAAEAAAMEAERGADEIAHRRALEAQQRAALKVEQAEEAAAAPAAELSRVRSPLGATMSLRTEWVHSELDRATLDLEALRPYLAIDALDKAVRAAIKAGIRTIRGVRIHQESRSR
jgi:hypothetical protein